MWENIIIIVIVALCLFFVGRRFIRQLGGGDKGGCGCSGGCGGCGGSSAKTDCEPRT